MRSTVTAIAAGVALVCSSQFLFADEYDKKTILTISQPIMVPGKVLPAGTYVMKLANSSSNRHIVQIFNEDQTELQAMILAFADYKVQRSDKTEFSYWETPAGMPPALRAWFWPGDNDGQAFAYPKDVADRLSAANSNAVVPIDDRSDVSQGNPVVPERQQTAEARPPQADVTSQAPLTASTSPAPQAPAVTATNNNNDIQTAGNNRNTSLLAQNNNNAAPPAEPTTVAQANTASREQSANVNTISELPQTASSTPWIFVLALSAFAIAATLRFALRSV